MSGHTSSDGGGGGCLLEHGHHRLSEINWRYFPHAIVAGLWSSTRYAYRICHKGIERQYASFYRPDKVSPRLEPRIFYMERPLTYR